MIYHQKMWTTSWPGGGQPPDLQNYVSRSQITIIIASQNHYKKQVFRAHPQNINYKMPENLRTYFWTPSVKKTLRVRRGQPTDQPPFFWHFPFLCVYVCVCVFFFLFFRSFLCKKFCFGFSVFLQIVFFFLPPCSASYYYSCFFCCFSLLLIILIIIHIHLLYLYLLLLMLLLTHKPKNRQERQTGLMIDGKHSNILVFLVLLMKQEKTPGNKYHKVTMKQIKKEW